MHVSCIIQFFVKLLLLHGKCINWATSRQRRNVFNWLQFIPCGCLGCILNVGLLFRLTIYYSYRCITSSKREHQTLNMTTSFVAQNIHPFTTAVLRANYNAGEMFLAFSLSLCMCFEHMEQSPSKLLRFIDWQRALFSHLNYIKLQYFTRVLATSSFSMHFTI